MDAYSVPPGHRAGFVAVVGRPNVGKSTLLNALLGQPIAATSPKPQTTQLNQLAILTRPDVQVIFVDTPGIHEPHHLLGEWMDAAATAVIGDADVCLVLFDMGEGPTPNDLRTAQRLTAMGHHPPTVVALNKADLLTEPELGERQEAFRALIPFGDPILTVSALDGENLDRLLSALVELLPEGPRYFPEEQITDRYERDVAADLIRSAAMQLLREELPHSLAVRIDEFTERGETGAFIKATLFVERESQKGIVIGKGGAMIRDIGQLARQHIEAMSARSVYLELRVKVQSGWRSDPNALTRFGFSSIEPKTG
jgi:GTP-binding protein Era